MKSVLLGTGAAEGIPALRCNCPVCENARKQGGKTIRTRSAFMIDEENFIDFGPDIFLQCVNKGIDFTRLKNIFLTHFHEDHLDLPNLIRQRAKLYASKQAISLIKEALPVYRYHGWSGAPDLFKDIEWIETEPFNIYEIDGIRVIPILASHSGYGEKESGFNYIITNKDNETYLYATDTGWYEKPTWDYLQNSRIRLKYAVIECTYGTYERPLYSDGHLNFKNLRLMLEKLSEYGMIDGKTPVYLTHISHRNEMPPEEITAMFKGYGFCVFAGYDGMEIKGE